MSTERDELVDLLAEADSPGKYLRNARQFIYGPTADTILKTFTRKPRTVTTAAELDALPVGSVVLLDGDAHQKREGVFWGTDGGWLTSRQAAKSAPITVLNEPTP